MAKSGQKRKRADKAKTKLKTSKKKSIRLRKGLNVTSTDFKTQKITVSSNRILGSQSENVDDRTSRKKIGVKDLMAKVSHLGISTRLEGLEGLLQLLKSYPDICKENLSRMTSQVLTQITDREAKIRSMARTVLRTMFSIMGDSAQMEPMYDVICAHVCLGLSHISSDIQLDSLNILDDIIYLIPGLVVAKYNMLLPNCLDQVSLSRKTKALLNNKLTSLDWRTSVLSRINKIVRLVVGQRLTGAKVVAAAKDKKWQDTRYACLDDLRDDYEAPSLLEVTSGLKEANRFDLECFLQNMVTGILRDTWCEAVSPQNLSAMNSVVDLLKMASNFDIDMVLKGFPYEELGDAKAANALNLSICHLYFSNVDISSSLETDSIVMTFMSNVDVSDVDVAEITAEIVDRIADSEVDNFDKLDKLVESLWRSHPYNERVIDVMSRLALNDNICRLSSVDMWITTSLVEALRSPKFGLCQLETLKGLFKRKDATLMKAVKTAVILDQYKNEAVQRNPFVSIIKRWTV